MSDDVVRAEMLPAEKESSDAQMQTNSLKVRSPLGERLLSLIEPDLDGFYRKVHQKAMDDPVEGADGKIPRSAGQNQLAAMKLYFSMLKMANTDVDVDRVDVQGGMDDMIRKMQSLTPQELRDLSSVAGDES
jgi:hypothetical protein